MTRPPLDLILSEALANELTDPGSKWPAWLTAAFVIIVCGSFWALVAILIWAAL